MLNVQVPSLPCAPPYGCGNMMSTHLHRTNQKGVAMRADMIGRWIGRAAIVAALGAAFLTVGGVAASAADAQQPDVAVQMGFDWN